MDNFTINVIPSGLNMILQLIATLILFLVIKHFLYGPIKEMFRKRQEFVMDEMAEATKSRKEAEELKSEYEEHLSGAKLEARDIVRDARHRSEVMIQDAAEKAKKEAARIAVKNEEAMERERMQALSDLREDVIELAMSAAEKVVQESVDKEKDRQLVEEFIQNIGEETWQE